MTRIAVVIPTYNERKNIARLIDETKRSLLGTDIVVSFFIVDDNSPDGTADAVKEIAKNDPNIHLISRSGKFGLGSAYIHAFKQILNNTTQFDVVIQMDADFSHPPQLIQKMVSAIEKDEADVIIGSRYSAGGSSKNWPFYRKVISKGANILANVLLNMKVKDVTSGYRAFRLNVLKQLSFADMSSKGYEYQIEILYKLSKMNVRIQELPFLFNNRKEGQSKLSFKDIMEFFKIVVNMRFKSFAYKSNVIQSQLRS